MKNIRDVGTFKLTATILKKYFNLLIFDYQFLTKFNLSKFIIHRLSFSEDIEL